MDADERSRAGLFLAFQYPVAIPGVTLGNFLRHAINARMKADDPDSKGIPIPKFARMMRQKMSQLQVDHAFAGRYLNEGFSGGEKKRAEVLQMAVLEPSIAILDETDSGLDIDALRIVAEGVNSLTGPDMGALVITHYQRMLNYIKPDFVHVMYDGRIVESGGPELALELEDKGYEWGARETFVLASGDSLMKRGADMAINEAVKSEKLLTYEEEALKEVGLTYAEKYGFHDDDVDYAFKSQKGINEKIVRQISAMKDEPRWMTDLRVEAYHTFMDKPTPQWGGDLNKINYDDIYYYVRATDKTEQDWDEVPSEIKETFDKLGIPEAEQKFLHGVSAQYDSESVYHKIQENLEEQGVIFLDMDSGLREHPDIVREYFTTVIPADDNKFAALNTAVWSGGSFIYVPPGVHVEMPLQAYFRINTQNMGQFERTLIIVDEGAYVHYVEGCTAPIYSLRQPAQRRGRNHRQGRRPLPLHHHPELVEQCLQSRDQARRRRERRDDGVGRWQPWQPP